MKKACCLLAISAILFSCTPEKKANQTETTEIHSTKTKELLTKKYAGTYSYGADAQKEPTGGISIYPLTDTTALFFIRVSVGPPSYNSGELADTLTIKDGMATYFKKEDYDTKGCKWSLKFQDKSISLKTLDECYECGFGASVIADQTYKLIDVKAPEYYINMAGDTTFFNKKQP